MGAPRKGGRTALRLSPRTQKTAPAGFDFTLAMRRLCEDAAARLPELGHIDMSRVAVAFCQTRRAVSHGLYASLTPMRFAGGAEVEKRRGRRYAVERLYDHAGRELLYILSFYLPRFMQVDRDEKLTTVFHELWHINPHFNGDLRRHAGRCYAHTHSQAQYDEQMSRLAQHYLSLGPPRELHSFLDGDFAALVREHGRVCGLKIRRPRLIPVE